MLGPVSPGRDSSGDEVLEVFYFCIFIVFISETWTNPPSALIRYVNTSVRKKYVRNTDFFDDSFFMRTPYVCIQDDDDSFLFTPSAYEYKTMTILSCSSGYTNMANARFDRNQLTFRALLCNDSTLTLILTPFSLRSFCVHWNIMRTPSVRKKYVRNTDLHIARYNF